MNFFSCNNKQTSIRKHILRILLISFFVLAGLAAVFIEFYSQHKRTKEFEYHTARLLQAADAQAEQLLSSMLIGEQSGSLVLQLERIKRVENLSEARFERLGQYSNYYPLNCRDLDKHREICFDLTSSKMSIIIPVQIGSNEVGRLVKVAEFGASSSYGSFREPTVFVIVALFVAFIVLALWVGWFVEKRIRLPLLSLDIDLTPILEGDNEASLKPSTITEINAVTKQVQTLIERYQDRTASEQMIRLTKQVAHDIRSPIAAIETLLPHLVTLPEQQRVFLRTALTRLRDIANSLVTKGDSKTGVHNLNEFSVEHLGVLIDSIVTEKRIQYRSRLDIELRFDLSTQGYALFARVNSVEFKRVLSNLINNAFESFKVNDKGLVKVTLVSAGAEAVISIADNGSGISDVVIARIGEIGNTEGKPSGSGLGLSHAQSTIYSLGGVLEAKRQIEGGTLIDIHLPLSPIPNWFLSELVVPPESQIVILDDDPAIHQVWHQRLTGLICANRIVYLSTPDQLREIAKKTTDENILYLCDQELLDFKESGLSLIAELGIEKNSILVTSRYDDKAVRFKIDELKIKVLPKALAHLVPIRLSENSPQKRHVTVLIDDDSLVHANWSFAFKSQKKSLECYESISSFLTVANEIHTDSRIYVDSSLGDEEPGEILSEVLYLRGFKNIFLCTGYCAEDFDLKKYSHVRAVVGKEPPLSTI